MFVCTFVYSHRFSEQPNGAYSPYKASLSTQYPWVETDAGAGGKKNVFLSLSLSLSLSVQSFRLPMKRPSD